MKFIRSDIDCPEDAARERNVTPKRVCRGYRVWKIPWHDKEGLEPLLKPVCHANHIFLSSMHVRWQNE